MTFNLAELDKPGTQPGFFEGVFNSGIESGSGGNFLWFKKSNYYVQFMQNIVLSTI